MKNIHTRPRRTVAALGLLLAITAAHAAPPAPADSTQRTFAQSVNIAAPLLAQMSAAQTATGGVSATFQALAGRSACVLGVPSRCTADLRFSSDGGYAGFYYNGTWRGNVTPASPGIEYAGLSVVVTGDGIVRVDPANLQTGTAAARMLSTEGVLYGGSWVMISR